MRSGGGGYRAFRIVAQAGNRTWITVLEAYSVEGAFKKFQCSQPDLPFRTLGSVLVIEERAAPR